MVVFGFGVMSDDLVVWLVVVLVLKVYCLFDCVAVVIVICRGELFVVVILFDDFDVIVCLGGMVEIGFVVERANSAQQAVCIVV